MNTIITQAAAHTANTTAVPRITSEIADVMDDLTGFHPALDRVIASIGDLLTTDMDANQSMGVVAAIGAFDTSNVHILLALALQQIANPDANPSLADLPTTSKQALRRLGAEYVAAADDSDLQEIAAWAPAVIDGI